jgi:cytochrome b subunit of formate dehydrogenase
MELARWNLRRAVGWLLLAFALLLVITGLGITEWQIVEAATFGLLSKALSFQLHNLLWIPFLAILACHMLLSCQAGKRGKD